MMHIVNPTNFLYIYFNSSPVLFKKENRAVWLKRKQDQKLTGWYIVDC
jgi:hypothetical protein